MQLQSNDSNWAVIINFGACEYLNFKTTVYLYTTVNQLTRQKIGPSATCRNIVIDKLQTKVVVRFTSEFEVQYKY